MHQQKHIRQAMALLLATVMMLAAVLAPKTAYAATPEEPTWADADTHDTADEASDPVDSSTNNTDVELNESNANASDSNEEPTESDADTNLMPGWADVDVNAFYLTGSLYDFRLITVEGRAALAIIFQHPDCTGFFATSNNLADWEIRSPAADWYVYHDGYYYWYRDGLYRTSDRWADWQVYTAPDDYEWEGDLALIIDIFDDAVQLPYKSLCESGILRIERLPYAIDERIVWVGFAVTEITGGSQQRRPMGILANGIWLNPLPADATPALVGLEGFGWARQAIEFVVARGLMDMYICPDTNEPIAFNPTGYATRGEVLAAAVMALGLTAPDIHDPYHVPFQDVPLSERGVYIDIAKRLGLVAGIGNNQFAPDRIISRQDMMTMLYNILLASGQITPDTGLTALRRFNDVGQIADYARLPISSLARAGIIAGNGISINPRGYMTRVEAAMFVYNLGLLQNVV